MYAPCLVLNVDLTQKLFRCDRPLTFVLLSYSLVTGMNLWLSVFSVGIVCTFYTTLVSVGVHLIGECQWNISDTNFYDVACDG